MVSIAHSSLISPEAQEIIAEGVHAFHHEGLRRLAALLPTDDAELQRWLVSIMDTGDAGAFQMVISAAALDGRNLSAELLPLVMLSQLSTFNLGWIAWRMHGNVTQELLRALDWVMAVQSEVRAMALFVAVAWWHEHRKGEPVPSEIVRWLDTLAKEKRKVEDYTNILLRDADILLGRPARSRQRGITRKDLTPAQERREPRMILALLDGPYERYIPAREMNVYRGTQPQRRAVEDVERNEPCPCGSGKKYKKCCWLADRKRLSRSTSVAGVTKEELTGDLQAELTEAHFDAMNPGNILTLTPDRVPEALQERYLISLLVLKAYEKAIAAFQMFGVPEHLKSLWSHMFKYATDSWRPDIARQLMEILPDAEEQFSVKTHAGIRVLLVGDDPAEALAEIERSAQALLKSKDLDELAQMTAVLLASPYRGLGILIAHGLLPIADEDLVADLFEDILDTRAKLNLPLEDELSDWMDERALREARRHETAEMQALRDQFEAKQSIIRGANEKIARLERDKLLSDRKARRETENARARGLTSEEQEREKAHKIEKQRLIALVKEANEGKLESRRALEKTLLAEKKAATEAAKYEEADDQDEDYKIEGNQPVRLIRFPKDFAETLAAYPKHVGRATMTRLGRLAAGEPSGFDNIKRLKAYPDVLRARLSDKHRLLFCMEPNHIRVVDLIRRADLDRRIERLKIAGLPPSFPG